LSGFEAGENLQIFFLLFSRIWMVSMSIHPIFEDLDGGTWEPSPTLSAWSLIVFVKIVETSSIPGFESSDTCKAALLLALVLGYSV
jgi:hypothetical protein